MKKKRQDVQDLEPVEMRSFDHKLVKGLKIKDQIAYTKAYNEEKMLIDEENRKKFRQREKLQDFKDNPELRDKLGRINYDREMGIHPSNLVDESLTEALMSPHSPIRKYISSKFNFEPANVSPFIHQNKKTANIAEDSEFIK